MCAKAEIPARDTLVEVGVVSRGHGLRGAMCIHLHNTKSNASASDHLYLETPTGQVMGGVRWVGWAGRTPLIMADTVTDRSRADQLKGALLLIPRAAVPLARDEMLYADLIGCRVVEAGVSLVYGTVIHVFEAGACEILVIQRASGTELMIPLVEPWIKRIDLGAKLIEVQDGMCWHEGES
jgi:16S rRNA processing protein RimM